MKKKHMRKKKTNEREKKKQKRKVTKEKISHLLRSIYCFKKTPFLNEGEWR